MRGSRAAKTCSTTWLQCLVLLACLERTCSERAYVSNTGECTANAPPGAVCTTFFNALQNTSVSTVVVLEDMFFQLKDWEAHFK